VGATLWSSPSSQAGYFLTLTPAPASQVAGTKPYVVEGKARVGDVQGALEAAKREAVRVAVEEILGKQRAERYRDLIEANILQEAATFVLGEPKPLGTPRVQDGQVIVKASVDVQVVALREALARVISDDGPPLPRVLVMVYEEILRRPARDPAAETAVKNALLNCGFIVLSPKGLDELRQRDIVRALRQGQWDEAEGLREQFKCEIIVAGEGFAEEAAPEPGMFPFKSRVEVEAYYPDTAQVRCSLAAEGSGMGPAALVAGKGALQQAGERIGKKLCECLSTGFTTLLNLKVKNLVLYDWADRIEEYLKSLPGIDRVLRRSVDRLNHLGEWDLVGPGARAGDVASGLRRCPEPHIVIEEVTGQSITAKADE